jgi:UDP-N-acetylmuramate dehydrogenase
VAEVRLALEPRDPGEIRAEVTALLGRRKATQPTNRRTFGSVFKNPPGEHGAGWLIEHCGLKGFRIGGAVISPRHANFIENAGGASSADALALMAEAHRRVRAQHGVELEHEVRFLGPLELPPL